MSIRFVEMVCLLGITIGAAGAEPARPNILWLTSEDNNVDWVGCYGNPHAETPNIDRLPTEGFQYIERIQASIIATRDANDRSNGK